MISTRPNAATQSSNPPKICSASLTEIDFNIWLFWPKLTNFSREFVGGDFDVSANVTAIILHLEEDDADLMLAARSDQRFVRPH